MIPETVASLAALLFLIAPGFVYQARRERRVPDRTATAFREVSGVALGSLVFTALALGLLGLVRIFVPSFMPDPGVWLRDGREYVDDNYRLVARFVVIQVVLACGIAALVNWSPVRNRFRWALAQLPAIGKHLPPAVEEGRITERTAWYTAFRDEAGTNTVYTCVRMKDGTDYFGYVLQFTPDDDDLAERELVLAPPLKVRFPDDEEPQALPADWHRMILHGAEIVAVLVSYPPLVQHP